MALQTFIDTNSDRYFPNDTTSLLRVGNTQEYLLQTIEGILRGYPPKLPWASPYGRVYRGLFLGPTPLAYFFLLLSEKQPNLIINGKTPFEWCQAYLNLGQETIPLLFTDTCGITNEYLAYNSVLACASKEIQYAQKVTSALRNLDAPPGHCERMNGRAGALYLLRMIRKFLPSLTEEIKRVTRILIEQILTQEPWTWGDAKRQYYGTVHGDIGIITQIIISEPSYAPQLEAKLSLILELQEENGNWPVVPEKKSFGLIHFCHGAPGIIVSLLAIREYFPLLHQRIDIAIERGRGLIWEKGLLKKEPNICHGITGNALALVGSERGHFLEHATPQKIREGIEAGIFINGDDPFGLLWGAAGRAWVWMNWQIDKGKCIPYTDV